MPRPFAGMTRIRFKGFGVRSRLSPLGAPLELTDEIWDEGRRVSMGAVNRPADRVDPQS